MIKLTIPVIVEGKYDKARLSGIVDCPIIPTHGFGVFRSHEKRALIRRLGQRGLILLCDSDGGGKTIRSHLKGMLGGIPVYDLYIPKIEGKEARKSAPSKEGTLGVEGIPNEILTKIFEDFVKAHPECSAVGETAPDAVPKTLFTKAKMYELRLTGTPDAAENRKKLCAALSLPDDITPNALCEAVNMISSAEEAERIMRNAE
ncbi:MAG: DUF4093 domain-containing protein [Clostridia bacterium]|nr:DUF4093 domain-containing protein [Clostridia bacterium]